MEYGLYLSATGVITSAYRQDLIANNLANSQTTGFKRDLATFAQRPPADQENPMWTQLGNQMLDQIGGGVLASPNRIDTSQGILNPTGNKLDLGIQGSGFFTVAGPNGQVRLTRDGQFRIDTSGHLTLATDQANPVLDSQGNPITLDPSQSIQIQPDGKILQNGQSAAQLGIVDVNDPAQLKKEGGSLMSVPNTSGLTSSTANVEQGYLEQSNVDPATALSELMDTQRQLEANANMLRFQDQTLGDLVNTVGKV